MYTETENYTPLDCGDSPTDGGQQFLERSCGIINAGAQAVMISIGHRSGLFDTMAQLEPATSQQIADQAVLAERYVREWLATMVTAMAEHYPQSRFSGYDLCDDAIAEATHMAEARGLHNIRFAALDMTNFDEPESYDFITSFDAVHDQKHPAQLIASIQRALKPAGIYLMQDIGGSAQLEKNLDFPMASLLYAISAAHCTPVSIGQGGEGLGAMWGWETAQTILNQAGFASVERHFLEHDPMNVWFVSRKEQYHVS